MSQPKQLNIELSVIVYSDDGQQVALHDADHAIATQHDATVIRDALQASIWRQLALLPQVPEYEVTICPNA